MDAKEFYDGLNDPQFQEPYLDEDVWKDTPARHRYVHGGFTGTEVRFCFYFPEKEAYQGRFYQSISPFPGDERETQNQTGEEDKIGFALTHGAYFVETNLGGANGFWADSSIIYRSSACAAQYSRTLASAMYGEHRPYGYAFGGSGGGYKTISCAESTKGVWDGVVPFVIGSPMAMPNVFTVRALAMRVLRHKFDEIKDALEPGGSGDPYATLNDEEKVALREVELMGFPMETWCVWDTIGEGALPVLVPGVLSIDPTYCADFWEKPGYLGASGDAGLARDRVVQETEIVKILHPQVCVPSIGDTIDEGNAYGVDEAWKHAMGKSQKLPVFVLSEYPEGDFYRTGMKLRFVSGALAGEVFGAICLPEHCVTIDVGMEQRDLRSLLELVRVGDRVVLDNSDYLALQTYHRHQVPGAEYHAWDQFRDEQGQPICPQRPVLTGPILSIGGAGSLQQGTPNCKVIVLESLMDESAFPWQADWYKQETAKHFGDVDDVLRLYYMEHCMHTDCQEGNGGDHAHIVSYLGALYQCLLDVSAWAEKGILPPAGSGYTMDGGQVRIPATAAERKGIQPVVHLTADGEERCEISAGTMVSFEAIVERPEGCGAVSEVTWDFEGTNRFLPDPSAVMREENGKTVIRVSHTFTGDGTFFPVVKVACNRNPGDFFTNVRNQARVRVVVAE